MSPDNFLSPPVFVDLYSKTSLILSMEAKVLGRSDKRKLIIIMADKTWVMYWMKAIRSPIPISLMSISLAPK